MRAYLIHYGAVLLLLSALLSWFGCVDVDCSQRRAALQSIGTVIVVFGLADKLRQILAALEGIQKEIKRG